jgi:signal recognition particle receptor subunit beta
MFINHTSKEVTAKIVYYGPGLSGKTTNLQYIFSVTNPHSRGELVSIETDIERTLFFDLLPINVGLVKGYQTKFQLYTVPGQIFYDSTRRLVLKGADGIVFVCDSQEPMVDANIESLENLKKNLNEQNQDLHELPIVLQYNKRDLNNLIPVEKLNSTLNASKWAFFEAKAIKGEGVIETLREISSLTLMKIKNAIEHSVYQPKERIAINFDTNNKKEIIKKEALPFKKISIDNISSFDQDEFNLELDQSEERVEELKVLEKTIKDSGLDLLHTMEDRSRITVIKKIPLKESELSIQVRDSQANILESIDIDVKPEIKKIMLILDVEK